jgi:hypothetical protein
LEKLIYSPSLFKQTLLDGWDKYCAESIVEGATIILDAELRAFITAFDFSKVARLKLDDILIDPT